MIGRAFSRQDGKPRMEDAWCRYQDSVLRQKEDDHTTQQMEMYAVLPAGRIPMCCWPSNTKLPIGCPSGLYAAPWLTEGSRRKPDCSQSWTQRKKERRHTKQSATVPVSALKHYIQLAWYVQNKVVLIWSDYWIKILGGFCGAIKKIRNLNPFCYLPSIQNNYKYSLRIYN